MRKRLIAFLGAFALLAGLAVVTPQQAQAYPLTGTHTVIAGCDQGPPNPIGHQQVSMNYTVTYLGLYNPPSTIRKKYSVQVNSATFTGVTAPQGVDAKVQLWNGTGPFNPSWLGMVGGGGPGPQIFPSGTATGPGPVTRTNGVGGVSWSPVTVYPASNEKEILFYIQFKNPNNQSCKIYFDMSQPDGPVTGATSMILHCETSADGMANDLNLSYTLEPVSNDTYFFEITNATYVSESGTGPSGGIDLKVTTDNSTSPPTTQSADSGTANWTSTPALFVEADGQNGVNFPTKSLTYTAGGGAFQLTATFNHDELGGTTDNTCSASWMLDTNWTPIDPVNGPSGASSETIDFNDCRPGVSQPHGHLGITSHWQYDANGNKVRPVDLTIDNDSSADIKFGAGTATTAGAITYKTNASPFNLTTMNSTATVTERTISAGATKSIDISSPAKYSRMNGAGHSDPVDIYETVAHDPIFELWPEAFDIYGAACVAADDDLDALVVSGPGPGN